MENGPAKIQEVTHLLNSLPFYNRYTLQYLLQLLVKVAANSDSNKMGPSNLSIVFGTI